MASVHGTSRSGWVGVWVRVVASIILVSAPGPLVLFWDLVGVWRLRVWGQGF